MSSRYMVPTMICLAPHYRLYAPDFPGFGRSEHPRHILTVAELAEVLLAWMDQYDLPQAVLLGNSMGCQIIAEAALGAPHRVLCAILVGPTMDPAAPSMGAQALRLLRDVRHESLASLVTQSRDYLACGLRRTVGTLRLALADPIESKLPHLHMPTLVVRGEHDPIAPQQWVETMVALLPRGQLAVIPGAPHAANFDAPEALARCVRTFLEAASPTPL